MRWLLWLQASHRVGAHLITFIINITTQEHYSVFSTQSTEYHPPSVVPQIDLMRQNIKYLLCQYFNSSFSCLECLRRCLTSAIPGTHWQLCPFLSPSPLTLMMFNTRVTTIKATIRGEPTIHSGDHNAWRPPTEAGTTKSTYQSSNRTSALWNG